MTEATTQLDAESKAIAAAADKAKADLTQGADTHVPTGSETAPPPRVDPFDARKALFAKSQARHDADAAVSRADNPGIEDLAARMEAESRGQEYVPGTPPAAPTPVANPAEPEYVPIQYQGRTVQVARSDIQRAGSEELYLRRREMADQAASLAVEVAAMNRRKAELDAETQRLAELRAEHQRLTAASHDGSANRPGYVPGTADPATGAAGNSDADLVERANQLSAMIYSGDPQDAAKAVLEILQRQQATGQTIDPEQVVDLAIARINARSQSGGTNGQPTPAPVVDPVWQRTVEEVNRVTSQQYPDVVNDPRQVQEAYAELQRLSALPQNRDRLVVDIALDACEAIRTKTSPPRAAVVDAKRGLPPTPSAGGAAPAAAEASIPSDKEYVQLLAERRRGRFGA